MTPLQMARFYSAIANGGKLVQPHILLDVENPNKTLVPTPAPAAPRPIPGLSPSILQIVQEGLYEGTHTPLGTSYGVFGQLPGADRRQDRHGPEGRLAPGRSRARRTSRGGAATARSTRRRSSSAP